MQKVTLVKDEDRLQVLELGALCHLSMAVHAAVKLDVPEIISKAGKNAQLLAAEIVAQIPACKSPSGATVKLDRILRALSCRGIFKESNEVDTQTGKMQRKYSLTSVSKLLVRNEDGISFVPWVLFNQDEIFMKNWHFLHQSVIEDKEAFRMAHGKGVFELAEEDPTLNVMINSMMATHSTIYVKAMLGEYQGFKSVKTLVDVGGGCGATLKVILASHPNIEGVNFDLQHVIDEAPEIEGVKHMAGDMFQSVPEGDAIFMKWILHDWVDEDCIKLLKNCYKSLPAGGKVVIMDVVLPAEQDSGSPFRFAMDMLMLAYCVGKERTEEEFHYIGKAAGFTEIEVILTVDFISVMEMRKT